MKKTATFSFDLKTGAATAKAEWGDGDLSTQRGLLAHVIKQLEYFLRTGGSPNPEYTRRDLQGYKEVWDTGSETLADLFFKTKDDARKKGIPFKDNLAVIAHIKMRGLWTHE